MAPSWRLMERLFGIQIQRTWSQFCHSFHDRKAFALPDESKRATLKAPRMCIYMIAIHQPYCQHRCIKPMTAVYIIHPMKRPRCLVFDSSLKLRSSSIVKTKAQDTPLPLCMCPACPQCPQGLLSLRLFLLLARHSSSKAKTGCKVNMFISNHKTFRPFFCFDPDRTLASR